MDLGQDGGHLPSHHLPQSLPVEVVEDQAAVLRLREADAGQVLTVPLAELPLQGGGVTSRVAQDALADLFVDILIGDGDGVAGGGLAEQFVVRQGGDDLEGGGAQVGRLGGALQAPLEHP